MTTQPPTFRNRFSDAPSLIEDVTEHGEITLASFGACLALGFRGNCDCDFIDRCFNLCHNRGIIGSGAKLRYPFGSKSFAYVVVRGLNGEDGRDRIVRGLAAQFRSELIMTGEVAPLEDRWDDEQSEHILRYDETKLDSIALARARAFFAEHIRVDHFTARFAQEAKGLGTLYGVGTVAAGEGSGGEE